MRSLPEGYNRFRSDKLNVFKIDIHVVLSNPLLLNKGFKKRLYFVPQIKCYSEIVNEFICDVIYKGMHM